MFNSGRSRLLLIIFFLSILMLFFIWYGSLEPDPEKGNYPNQEHLIESYEEYMGEEVKVRGRVIETDPVKIEAKSDEGNIVLKITGVEKKVKEGDRLTVYGVVEEDKTIHAQDAVIYSFLNWAYMYVISTVAALWVLIRIVKQWRWDSKTMSLKPREKPLNLMKRILEGNGDGGESDG